MHHTNLPTDLQNIGSVHGEDNSIFYTLYIQYRTKRVQPNNANLVSLYKSAAFFQFREITM